MMKSNNLKTISLTILVTILYFISIILYDIFYYEIIEQLMTDTNEAVSFYAPFFIRGVHTALIGLCLYFQVHIIKLSFLNKKYLVLIVHGFLMILIGILINFRIITGIPYYNYVGTTLSVTGILLCILSLLFIKSCQSSSKLS